MSSDSDRSYELLGVRPGVSPGELKAAYRDLIKVWHPDRFGHDPRLKEKAQEKLKEINEAYEELSSGRRWRIHVRPQSASPRDFSKRDRSYSRSAVGQRSRLIRVVLPLVVFGAVFVFTTRFLINKVRYQNSTAQPSTDWTISDTAEPTTSTPARSRSSEVSLTDSKLAGEQAVPTTTVMVDSATGLLARPECPTKIGMTYPSGSEPHAYCNVHPAPPTAEHRQQSKLKTLEKKAEPSSTEPPTESDKSQPPPNL